jgi:hypothetical protein
MIRLLIAAVMLLPCLILLLPVFLIAGAMLLFASCVQAIGRLFEPEFVPWTEIMAFDPQLGWRPRADIDTCYLADRDDIFRVVTDRDGWPGTRSLDESAVVVIGDSFAFGYGVDAGKSFADLNPGPTIKAVGAPGYSMVQSVILMEQFAKRLTGKLVVWFVCLENDLQDNLAPAMRHYRSPFARLSVARGGWEIAADHLGPRPWQSTDRGWTRILPHLCVPGPLADRAYAASDYLIGRGSACCRQIGAQLVLVTIPDPSQLTATGRAGLAALSGNPDACDANLPDRRIVESCSRYGVPAIVGKDHLSAGDYKRIERLHWNAQGHRKMAEILRRTYESFQSGTLEGFATTARGAAGVGSTTLDNRIQARDEPPLSIGAR